MSTSRVVSPMSTVTPLVNQPTNDSQDQFTSIGFGILGCALFFALVAAITIQCIKWKRRNTRKQHDTNQTNSAPRRSELSDVVGHLNTGYDGDIGNATIDEHNWKPVTVTSRTNRDDNNSVGKNKRQYHMPTYHGSGNLDNICKPGSVCFHTEIMQDFDYLASRFFLKNTENRSCEIDENAYEDINFEEICEHIRNKLTNEPETEFTPHTRSIPKDSRIANIYLQSLPKSVYDNDDDTLRNQRRTMFDSKRIENEYVIVRDEKVSHPNTSKYATADYLFHSEEGATSSPKCSKHRSGMSKYFTQARDIQRPSTPVRMINSKGTGVTLHVGSIPSDSEVDKINHESCIIEQSLLIEMMQFFNNNVSRFLLENRGKEFDDEPVYEYISSENFHQHKQGRLRSLCETENEFASHFKSTRQDSVTGSNSLKAWPDPNHDPTNDNGHCFQADHSNRRRDRLVSKKIGSNYIDLQSSPISNERKAPRRNISVYETAEKLFDDKDGSESSTMFSYQKPKSSNIISSQSPNYDNMRLRSAPVRISKPEIDVMPHSRIDDSSDGFGFTQINDPDYENLHYAQTDAHEQNVPRDNTFVYETADNSFDDEDGSPSFMLSYCGAHKLSKHSLQTTHFPQTPFAPVTTRKPKADVTSQANIIPRDSGIDSIYLDDLESTYEPIHNPCENTEQFV